MKHLAHYPAFRKCPFAARIELGGLGLATYAYGPPSPAGVVVVIPGASASLSPSAALVGGFDTTLQTNFAAQRLATVVFHHRGTGRSDGELSATSLATREQDVRAVVDAAREWFPSIPVFIFGISMGGHLAALLAEELQVAGVALVCAAAYSGDATHKPFGPEFSATIRRENSWVGSPAFDALTRYDGLRLVIASELDEVVPRDLSNTYFQSADISALLPGAKHRVPSREDESTKRAAMSVARLAASAFSAAIDRD